MAIITSLTSTVNSEVILGSKISVGNLGGFDLGGILAKDPENVYFFQAVDRGIFDRTKVVISYAGKFGGELQRLIRESPERELVYQTIQQFLQKYGGGQSYNVLAYQNIPLRRGSGASASARGATWTALNTLNNVGLTSYEVVRDVAGLEGHWDNIAPNIFGGYVYITPEGDKDANLIAHPPIPNHEMMFIVPPFEKQSTDVLRPPVKNYKADLATLEDALYRAAMVFASTGSLDFLTLPQGERERIVQQFAEGAPEEVPMPYIVTASQSLIAYLNEKFRKVRLDPRQRLDELGEHTAKDRTHIKARANYHPFPTDPKTGGYGPYNYDDLMQLTDEIREDGGYLTVSGAGPNLIVHFNGDVVGIGRIQRMTSKARYFLASFGYKPEELTFIITKPSADGIEQRAFSSHRKDCGVVTIGRNTLEELSAAG